MGPRIRTSQQEVRHVYAGDQQHKSHRAEQDAQNRLHGSEHPLAKGNQRSANSLVRVRIRLGQIARHAFHIRTGLLDTDPRLQSADSAHAQARAAIAQIRIGPLRDGRVNFIRAQRSEQVEIFRNHADDRVLDAVEYQARPQHVRCRA